MIELLSNNNGSTNNNDPHGIFNLGNTCFIAAPLQGLLYSLGKMLISDQMNWIEMCIVFGDKEEIIHNNGLFIKNSFKSDSPYYCAWKLLREIRGILLKIREGCYYDSEVVKGCVETLFKFFVCCMAANDAATNKVAKADTELLLSMAAPLKKINEGILDSIWILCGKSGKTPSAEDQTFVDEKLCQCILDTDERELTCTNLSLLFPNCMANESLAEYIVSLLPPEYRNHETYQDVLKMLLTEMNWDSIYAMLLNYDIEYEKGEGNFIKDYVNFLLQKGHNITNLYKKLKLELGQEQQKDVDETLREYQKHQDPSELLVLLFDYILLVDPVLRRAITGTEIQKITCTDCGAEDEDKKTPYSLLNAVVPKSTHPSLSEFLDYKDDVTRDCSNCEKSNAATIKKTTFSPPPIFFVHMTPYLFNEAGGTRIINNIQYRELEYIDGQFYLLRAVVEHSGVVDGGHYIAMVNNKNKNGLWYHMDDRYVSPTMFSHSENACILFYERVSLKDIALPILRRNRSLLLPRFSLLRKIHKSKEEKLKEMLKSKEEKEKEKKRKKERRGR
ncbi:MAG: ubiquitin carboxyl-terminal hydrolase [Holosporales bacterium]|nr:ubiquitin carboxyl-terminal hydrolase [Holosporales bacterium]